MLNESSLENVTDLAVDLLDEIQDLIGSSWNIDFQVPDDMGTITGTTDDITYKLSYSFDESGTIIPGVPAYTITPAAPATTITPATPAYTITPGVPKSCVWGVCTPSVPPVMSPAVPAVVSPAVPAVMSPAIPATTGSVSGSLFVDVEVKGIPDALDPLLEGTVLTSSTMSDPDSSGLSNQNTSWTSSGTLDATELIITTSFGYDDLEVEVAGVTTNFGSLTLPLTTLPTIPPISGSITTSANWPSYSDDGNATRTTDQGVVYELFPQINDLALTGFSVDITDSILETYLVYDLEQLDNYWNEYVCGAFDAVGAGAYCLPSPAEDLIEEVEELFDDVDGNIGVQVGASVNADLTSFISQFLPYTQAIAAATWNYSDYPILPSFNYTDAIMTGGLFSNADASNSNFTNADLESSDFSNANLSGAIFTGANLTDANFSGATGAPSNTDSSARAGGTNFTAASLFGANLKRSKNLDLTGAFINAATKTNPAFNPEEEGVTTIDHNMTLLSNNLLKYQHYIHNPAALYHDIANNINPATHQTSDRKGIRSRILAGKIDVNTSNFQADQYYDDLPEKLRKRIDSHDSEDRSSKIANYYVKWSTQSKRVSGDSISNKLAGFHGNDVLRGKGGNDILIGKYGADRLHGGAGNDHYKGGFGSDIFKVSKGNDVVRDFNPAHRDVIDLRSAESISIHGNEKQTIITTNLGSMTLNGVASSTLQELYELSIGPNSSYSPILSTAPVNF